MNFSEEANIFSKSIFNKYAIQYSSEAWFCNPYIYSGVLYSLALCFDRKCKLFYEIGTTSDMSGRNGHSTFIFAETAEKLNGNLITIQTTPSIPKELISRNNIKLYRGPSYIAATNKKVDFFHLNGGSSDGIDFLLEVPMILELCHDSTIILLDGWDRDKLVPDAHDKCKFAVLEYIKRGWFPVYRGYHIILIKK